MSAAGLLGPNLVGLIHIRGCIKKVANLRFCRCIDNLQVFLSFPGSGDPLRRDERLLQLSRAHHLRVPRQGGRQQRPQGKFKAWSLSGISCSSAARLLVVNEKFYAF